MGTQRLSLSIVSLLLLLITCNSFAETTIQSARLWRAPDNTRVVFDLTGPVKHNQFILASPDRLIIDIANIKLGTSLDKLDLKNTPIKSVRSSVQTNKDLRLVFDLSAQVTTKVFTLAPNKPYGHRLVVDLFDETDQKTTTPPAKTPTATPTPTPTEKPSHPPLVTKPVAGRDIIIAIDPGHGGEDPGAIGSRGAREKTVVLQIARELQRQINQEKGFRAELTRRSDYFIPLRQRPQLARKMTADLFISIHADAAPRTSAYGASVYALSDKGATSETARWLADAENQSDLIGGVSSSSDPVLAGVLLDLSMTAVMSSSLDVGQKILNSMGTITKLHKKRVEQAGFMVLKSPDIPSVLVETGFISNPNEAQKLVSASHQQALARTIKAGTIAFFKKSPPPGTYIEQLRHSGQIKMAATTHKVAKGDTLSGVAKQYGTTMAAIRAANNLPSNNINIGQTLKIPTR